LLRAESLQKPIVIFLEDIHWLDNDTSAFLAFFVRTLKVTEKQYPIAVITTQRPEGEGAVSDDISMHGIKLGKLSSASVHSLAEDILGKPVDDALSSLLDERAEGNPFFAEQILRYLSENNLLTLSEDGTYAASGQARESLPIDVRAVMVARLDRLTQQVRETVQTASVLGREFVVDVLVQMLHPQRDELPGYVYAAEKANIWTPVSEIDYIFRHALLRDAA
jgi:predicted ATPase